MKNPIISINTKDVRFPVAEDLYGLFFEDINRSGDGGIYPEMIRNRSFEDSILPGGCTLLPDGKGFVTRTGWRDQFNGGEGLERWGLPEYTPVPGWYTRNAEMILNTDDVMNKNREASLSVAFSKNGLLYNIGYHGVPSKSDSAVSGYLFVKTEKPADLTVFIASNDLSKTYAEATVSVSGNEFVKYDFRLIPDTDDYEAVFGIRSEEECSVQLGFTSLMPEDTFMGHGLRKDLCEMLKKTSSKFFRFPGGCIVEGFTKETAMRFSRTIGPVWERPSHQLMWHYRATNGLGFHEYLQLCEDLELEPLYVINCGLTCQGRREDLFEGEELDEFLQEAFDAIDYAIAPSDTPMGAKRAAAGHPEPFAMKYIEIGNENLGPDYLMRYKLFYEALKERYPQLQYIANVHVENDGLKTDIVDEHYYNTPEFFARHFNMFDSYDRSQPKIFVGEYAVTCGRDIGNLRSAIAESMYLIGIENNQDHVNLTAYAPLFNHVNYTSWSPDLIAYDNHRAAGIPFYHALTMLAADRGKNVVTITPDVPYEFEKQMGLPGILASGSGVKIRNMTCNGEVVRPSHNIVSDLREEDGIWTAWQDDNSELMKSPGLSVREVLQDVKTYITFGETEVSDTVLEAEVFLENPDVKMQLSFWIHNNTMLHNQDETKAAVSKLWTPIYTNRYVWSLQNGVSSIDAITRSRYSWRGPKKELPEIRYNSWMKLRVEAKDEQIRCYIDGQLVMDTPTESFPVIASTASTENEDIIVKIANIHDGELPVTLCFDCDVKAEYEGSVLTGSDFKAENTLDCPENVSPYEIKGNDAAAEFVYNAPGTSLSILRLHRN